MAAALRVIVPAASDRANPACYITTINMLQTDRVWASVKRACGKDGVLERMSKVGVPREKATEIDCIMLIDLRKVVRKLS